MVKDSVPRRTDGEVISANDIVVLEAALNASVLDDEDEDNVYESIGSVPEEIPKRERHSSEE